MKNSILFSCIILSSLVMHLKILAQESWIPTSVNYAPSGRSFQTVVWTGSKMIIWGGNNNYGYLKTGGVYDPISNTWAVTDSINGPNGRYFHTAVWTGSRMLIWGGRGPSNLRTGKSYDPVTNNWNIIDTANAPSAREMHTAVWTGSKMIIWGGQTNNGTTNTGGMYDPISNTWTTMSTTNAPSPRKHHSAVWVGSKMIIWGGDSTVGSYYLKTGGVYDPSTDTWTSTSLSNCPAERNMHTAVWTGSKMIIWGGHNPGSGYLFTGGRYDPVANVWTTTSDNNVPAGRSYHTAIWTGSKMVIWGGSNGSGSSNLFYSGGIYNQANDSWDSTTTTGAPVPRSHHSAVWTGSTMIIWGGSSTNYLNTGGKYINPTLVGIEPVNERIPSNFELKQNFPNPFNPSTTIQYDLTKATNVKLIIIDMLGEEITELVNTHQKAGEYEVIWDASNFASGVYFYKFETESFTDVKKMILLK
ncbi:MAG: T9SS C-terminal target domain-containing protein [Ignavibacteriae bacterium]|nr:MAG: T9SS C-terminal target domain-containing protein [Ignavibacteriota bacterium]